MLSFSSAKPKISGSLNFLGFQFRLSCVCPYLFHSLNKIIPSLSDHMKNWVILTKKIESLAEMNFDPGFLAIEEYLIQIDAQYRVKMILNIESKWFSISSQNDSQYRVKMILNIESKWFSISSQNDSQYRVKMILNIESKWFSISSQNDSQYRVKMILNIESKWFSISSQNDSQYRVKMILNIESKWLNIEFQYSESRVEF